MAIGSLIAQALCDPDSVRALFPTDWDLLVRQARRANLLAKLAWRLEESGLIDAILPAALPHLVSARALATRQDTAIRWEIECIQDALIETEVPLILLKGAAYVIARLPVAKGRLFSDVDILVPKSSLGPVESALMQHGWSGTHHDAYYQRYYRQWMHEIPPMQHARRGTVIDVHHALLPETARIKARSDLMLVAAVKTPESSALVLAPEDMILHSATHLFHEGELDNGLRDLFDLDGLIRHFAVNETFWHDLLQRSRQVGLARPLFYAVRYANRIARTPVPATVLQDIERDGPRGLARRVMDFCFLRGLQPDHASCSDGWTGLARWVLYLRSHWLRMPIPLLVYHLTRKALFTKHEAAPKEADAFHHAPKKP